MITLYGASGHAKVIIDIIKSNNESINHIMDDNENIDQLIGYPVLKPCETMCENVIIAIGDNKIRKRIVEKLSATYSKAIIHSSAVIGSDTVIGDGTVIMARVVINTDAKIGTHCIINTASIIEHDAVIGDFVHISPGAIITGNVIVGNGSQIGAGAIVLPNIKIGKNVIVGAGTVVIKDIEDNTVVVGNPARKLKKIKDNE